MKSKRVINGTFGELWVEGKKVGECKGLTAKLEFNKEDVNLPRQLATDKKVMGWEGTGTVTMFKVNSRMANLLEEQAKEGKDLRFTIVSKLADPDSYGAERVAVKGVSFDDLTLADWETGGMTDVENPFTFTDYKFYDKIDAQ